VDAGRVDGASDSTVPVATASDRTGCPPLPPTGTFTTMRPQPRLMTDAETPNESDDGGRLFSLTRDKLLVATLLLVGVAGSGLARRLLGELGYNDLGALVYIVGYSGMVVGIWYGWIRPLEITGPD